MFLKFLNRMRKTISFRLTLWYMGILILISSILFVFAYFYLSHSVRQQYRQNVIIEAQEFVTKYQTEGVGELKKEVELENEIGGEDTFFVRLAGPENNTVFLALPEQWNARDLKKIETVSRYNDREWTSLKVGEVEFEIITLHLPDGGLLQVGKSAEARHDLIKPFQQIFFFCLVALIIFGLMGGIFLTFHTLQPVRKLIDVLQSILETGKIDARVPTRRTGDELDELSTLFNKMLEKIEVLIKGMRNSLDNVSHDLRTPMTRLRGIAEIALQSDQSVDALREALSDCIEESERILTLLNTLMDISEAETGVMKLDLKKVNLSALIFEVVDLYNCIAEEKGVFVHVNCSEDIILSVDHNKMRQALANILDNAIKYTPAGGRIDIENYQEHHHFIIKFKDTGVGITPDELSQIWDRLYRGDRNGSQRGLGLGLSLVKAIVQAHKGYVDVSSVPKVGSLFSIYLPRV